MSLYFSASDMLPLPEESGSIVHPGVFVSLFHRLFLCLFVCPCA